jgi:serine/threonine protein phosphatase PrpC
MNSEIIDSSNETLSRGNPISEFLDNQRGEEMGMLSQEEFHNKFENHINISSSKIGNNDTSHIISNKSEVKNTIQQISGEFESEQSNKHEINKDHHLNNNSNSAYGQQLEQIVLKFTTFSESVHEAPSFHVNRDGARIGRDTNNEVSVPSDHLLAHTQHALISFSKGSFYIIDNGHEFSASVRIGTRGNNHQRNWIMELDARFSAGHSIFRSKYVDKETGFLVIDIVEGPLQGEQRTITKAGATIGRSSENTICVPDRELSRKHSKIEFDEKIGRFIVCDIGSTNGTYMQLVGPYGGRHRLHLNDHILVGRTGFSINRFDYGLSEEMGHRQTMEDACAIVQHLNITPLAVPHLSPQSFFGVFDGHGGHQASLYLSQTLHINVSEGLDKISTELLKLVDPSNENELKEDDNSLVEMDKIIMKTLKDIFLETDADFVSKSKHPQHGSTATTALILGKRLYCANVGDSRTLLCRNFVPIAMSQDHKPSREDESKRIRDAGGFVINNRVMGELAVSRAFGDADFKKGIQNIIEDEGVVHDENESGDLKNWDEPLIIAEPDIKSINITTNDQFLLLACDGLFDVFTGEDLVTFITKDMLDHGDAQRCCQHLTHEAIKKRNSRDNVSVILVILNKWY